MERETYKVILPVSKQEVVLKAWITGREKRDLKKPYYDQIDSDESGALKDTQTRKQLTDKVENLIIETIVVSIGGNATNLVEQVLGLHSDDYDFIIKEINKITKPNRNENPTNTVSGIAGGGTN